jgi:hypothetical protein
MSIGKKVMDSTGLGTLLASLGASSKEIKEAADVALDLEIGKAVGAESLKPGEHVADRWDEGQMHRAPTKEEIKTGPVQAASGGGAERMIAEYSRPAPQDGTVTVPAQLAAELGQMRGYMKSQAELVGKLMKGQETLTSVLTAFLTKEAAQASGVDENAETRFSNIYVRKAQGFAAAARIALAKAGSIREGLGELQPEARKIAKAQIKDLRKRAARLVSKSLEAAFAAKSEDSDPALEVRKAMTVLLDGDESLKADVSAFHEKDERENEEKREKKKMKKAIKAIARKVAQKAAKKAKAAADAAAAQAGGEAAKTQMQADSQDKDSKNQAAKPTTEKTINPDDLKKALEGLGILEGKISDVMEIVAGRPVTNNVGKPLELLKSDTGASKLIEISSRIDEAVASDRMDTGAEMKARDLLQKVDAVRRGVMSQDLWQQQLLQAPQSVKDVFQMAA